MVRMEWGLRGNRRGIHSMNEKARSHCQDLAIRVLGPLAVTREGLRRTLPASRKMRGLLAYLALAPRPCRREDLCDLLWDQRAADPRGELRWTLGKIRVAVGPWLRATSEGIALAREELSIDAVAFRKMARGPLSERNIAEALAMWQGSVLADVEVKGQHAFQAWLAAERDALTGLRIKLLKAAVDCAWARPEEALLAARRLVAEEPWDEWGHARVVQSLERCGRHAVAATYMAATRRALSRELAIPEEQVLTALPPLPGAGSIESPQPQTRKQVPRPVLRFEPLQLVPHNNDLATLAAQATADLGLGLWRNRCCDVLDEAWPAPSPSDDNPGVDFTLRGTLVQLDDAIQFSLRCVDLRTGTVIWFGRIEPRRPFARNLAQWIEGAVEAIGAAIRATGSGASDSGRLWNRLLMARSFAGTLQPETNRKALELLNAILAEDADEPNTLALAAWCYAQRAVYNWSANPDQDRDEAKRCAAAATRINMDDPECLTTIAAARTLVADLNGAEALLGRALRLNPYASGALARSGWLANYVDEPERAARHFRMALTLAPLDAASFNSLAGLGVAHFIRGDYVEAIRCMEQALALNPKAVWIYRNLVPAYVAAKHRRKAEDGVHALMKEHPNLTVAAVCDAMVFSPTVMAKIADGLRAMGLPYV